MQKDRKMITRCISQDVVKVDYVRLECSKCHSALEIKKEIDESITCPVCNKKFQDNAVDIVNAIFINKRELSKMGADKVSLVSYEE